MKTSAEANAEALTPLVLAWAAWATLGRLVLTALAHYSEAFVRWEVWMGIGVSGVCGLLYSLAARRSAADAAWHGGMVGGIGGFLGIAVGAALADQTALDLLTGTLQAISAGAIAGVAAHVGLVRGEGA